MKVDGFTVHDKFREDFRPITEHCERQDLILVTGGIQCANCGAMIQNDKEVYTNDDSPDTIDQIG
jgi:hypothetical protein